jgi:thymidylate synthase
MSKDIILLPPNDAIESARAIFEELAEELQNWRDSIPESLQNGEKADQLDGAIEALTSAADSLVEPPVEDLDGIEEGKIPNKASRPKRCAAAVTTLANAVEAARDEAERLRLVADPETATAREEAATAWEEWADEIEAAQQAAEEVDFPRMFG